MGSEMTDKIEPFGYFKAEPFGWTDCAEGDEGAVALYEAPADLQAKVAELEAKNLSCRANGIEMLATIAELHDNLRAQEAKLREKNYG